MSIGELDVRGGSRGAALEKTYERAIYDVAKLYLRDYGDVAVIVPPSALALEVRLATWRGTHLGAGNRSDQGAVAHRTASGRDAAVVNGAMAL